MVRLGGGEELIAAAALDIPASRKALLDLTGR
jgi:hypothetical protein